MVNFNKNSASLQVPVVGPQSRNDVKTKRQNVRRNRPSKSLEDEPKQCSEQARIKASVLQECKDKIKSTKDIVEKRKLATQQLPEDILDELETLRQRTVLVGAPISELKAYVDEKEAHGEVGLGDELGAKYQNLLTEHARQISNIKVMLKASGMIKDLMDPMVNQSSSVQYLVGPEPPR